MAIADFIHLKVRSAYSLTEGANKVDKIVSLAKEASMPAVAITDRGNLFGALEFSQYAAGGGIQRLFHAGLGGRGPHVVDGRSRSKQQRHKTKRKHDCDVAGLGAAESPDHPLQAGALG